MGDKFNDIDALLNGIIRPNSPTLQEVFDKKLADLGIAPTAAFEIMGVQSRTMKGILTGSQKLVDVTNLTKLASFLQLPREEIIKLFLEAVEKNFPTNNISGEEISFIKENFDLSVLKKAGLIHSITDFDHIKKRVIKRLGLRSIFEYRKPTVDIAFSSGLFKPESNLTRAFWIKAALASLEELHNPYPYDRDALIKIFPRIRWYTMNVQRGLIEVTKLLFKIGITVIFQPSLQTLQLRGATFSYNNKPCIVLTNYQGFYSTLWFALIHELYHVLFDWEEIKANKYHLTDDSNEQLSVQEREKEADNFAREYLFSKEKLEPIRPYINDAAYVAEFASNNHIHPSIIYVFYAYDTHTTNRKAWARAKKYSPDIDECIKPINILWEDESPVEEIIPKLALEAYS